MSNSPRLTLIAGPTASGKSRLALEMARKSGAVIINADSQQLYADLRILTARPTLEDEAEADHRLYGVADASETWSVGTWSRAVLALLDELDISQRAAILVGGTGLYFNALTKGLAEIPAVDPTLRDELNRLFDKIGEAEYRQRLAAVDPVSETRIMAGDRQRLLRSYSVFQATGKALTAWQAQTRPLLRPDSYRTLLLQPERSQLYANCDKRVLQMMDQGAIAETEALLARNLDPCLPAMKAVGLPELSAYIRGKTSYEAAIFAVSQSTRHYAKRQMTWFRNQCRDWPTQI